MIIESNVRCVDPLLGEWPWNEGPMLLVSRPPWLRIKDRVQRASRWECSQKEAFMSAKEFQEPDGETRFSAIKGNVNLTDFTREINAVVSERREGKTSSTQFCSEREKQSTAQEAAC